MGFQRILIMFLQIELSVFVSKLLIWLIFHPIESQLRSGSLKGVNQGLLPPENGICRIVVMFFCIVLHLQYFYHIKTCSGSDPPPYRINQRLPARTTKVGLAPSPPLETHSFQITVACLQACFQFERCSHRAEGLQSGHLK